jgi:hypothetical protein
MTKYISTKTIWVSTSGWRGHSQPINAVAGANNTGSWDDSPCPSHICESEIKDYRAMLKKNKIASRLKVCQTSNVFCVKVFVLVHPDDKEKALELAKEHKNNTTLFYPC